MTDIEARARRIALNHGQVLKNFGTAEAVETTTALINKLVTERCDALEALAVELGILLTELVDIEGPQPGTSDWAVEVKAALASPLLAELLGKEAGR